MSLDEKECSFCGQKQDEVRSLIEGPSIFICNECVFLFNDILLKGSDNPDNSVYIIDLARLVSINKNIQELRDLLKGVVYTSKDEHKFTFSVRKKKEIKD